MIRWKRLARLAPLTLLAAIALAVSACPGGNGDDDDDDDDDDAITPQPFDVCQVVWVEPASGDLPAIFDFFLIDAERSQWVGGTVEYNVNDPIAVLYYHRTLPSESNPNPQPLSAAITTAGSFQLVLGNGTATGGTVDVTDTPGQEFYDLEVPGGTIGARVGTGLELSFDGVWSDPDPDASLTPGDGAAHILYLTSDLTIGPGYGTYAICYASTQAATFEERARLSMDRITEQMAKETAR